MKQDQTPGGCFVARDIVPGSQLTRLEDLLRATGRMPVHCQQLLAIEFDDGFDALFVRVTNSPGAPAPVGAVHEEVFAQFVRLNDRRRIVLAALRHHAAATGVAVREDAGGRWDVQLSGGGTSELHVGPRLTRLVNELEPGAALVRLLEQTWLPRLEPEAANRLVSLDGPPAIPVRWKSDAEIEPLFGPGILALDCKAVEGEAPLPKDPTELLDALAPTRNTPAQLALNRLVERVGRNRFSFDLLGKGEALLEFTDGLDRYRVHPRSKRLNREVSREGIDATVERLAREFQSLDSARGATLRLVETVMAQAGFALDDEEWWFGKTQREARFEVGRTLTLKLLKQSPEDVVGAWLDACRILPGSPTVVELRQLAEAPVIRAERKWLPQAPEPVAVGRLPALAALDLHQMDALAQEAIRQALEQAEGNPGVSRIGDSEDLLHLWSGPFWYRPSDTWVDQEWWQQFAKKAWELNRRHLAAVLLLTQGDRSPWAEVIHQARSADGWCSEDWEPELLWLMVNELSWSIDEDEYPRFAYALYPPPPQMARRAARRLRQALARLEHTAEARERAIEIDRILAGAAVLDTVSASEWLQPGEVLKVKDLVWNQAAQADRRSLMAWSDPLVIAAAFGWRELVDVLSRNPEFVAAQFAVEQVFAEPGHVALRLSWVAPCELAARFAACSLLGPPQEIQDRRVHALAGGAAFIDSSRAIIRQQLQVDGFAAGIAWHRCRTAEIT